MANKVDLDTLAERLETKWWGEYSQKLAKAEQESLEDAARRNLRGPIVGGLRYARTEPVFREHCLRLVPGLLELLRELHGDVPASRYDWVEQRVEKHIRQLGQGYLKTVAKSPDPDAEGALARQVSDLVARMTARAKADLSIERGKAQLRKGSPFVAKARILELVFALIALLSLTFLPLFFLAPQLPLIAWARSPEGSAFGTWGTGIVGIVIGIAGIYLAVRFHRQGR